jgi:hypothetical protein
MPNAAMCWAHEHKLPHLEKWTLVLIANWADQDGFGSTVISHLSEEGGMTDVQSESSILKLSKRGILKILHISGFDADKKYEYKLDWRMD